MVVNLLANSGTHTHFDDSEEEEDDVVINTVVGKDKTATTSGRAKSGGAVRVSDSPAAAAGRTKASSKILVEQVDEVDTLQPETLISISFAIHHLATRTKVCTAGCRR